MAAGSAAVRTERPKPAARTKAASPGRGLLARIRLLAPIRLLDRPLTSYYLVLGATLLLTMLGLVMVLSASSIRGLRWFADSFYFVDRQAIWVGIGLPILWVASRLPVRAYRALAYPLLLGTLGLLLLVALPGVGHEVNGNRNWLVLTDSIRIQPAEFAKLALVIWGADLIARKQALKLLGRARHLFVPLVPAVLVIVALVLLGGDLGTAVILVAVLLALLWFAGTPIRFFAALVTVTVLAAAYFASIDGERASRLTAFRDPFADVLDTGYQAGQGLYALASGGLFGVGLGASRQKWGALPEPHTDFIFAIIGEELGLV
ncbi:MAG: FtsW/RodA/SpoVE family cell cycle protein, partial [Actinomycetes bacterium]